MTGAGLDKTQGGFSLIELLAALAILGFVITALYSFYFTGLNSWNRSIERMDSQQSARIAMDKMVRELRYAESVTIPEDKDNQEIHFQLKGDSRTYLFRKAGSEIVYERLSPYFHNKVALHITALNFTTDENQTITIIVSAGSGAGEVTLTGKIRPRNIP